MERLILKCGRYVSPARGDTESRVRAVELYLAKLTEELEFLTEELGRVLEELKMAAVEPTALAAAALSEDVREENYE